MWKSLWLQLRPSVCNKTTLPARENRQKYVIDHNKEYVFGCSVRCSTSYAEIADEVFDMLNDGQITCKIVAVKAMQSLVVSKAREQADKAAEED